MRVVESSRWGNSAVTGVGPPTVRGTDAVKLRATFVVDHDHGATVLAVHRVMHTVKHVDDHVDRVFYRARVGCASVSAPTEAVLGAMRPVEGVGVPVGATELGRDLLQGVGGATAPDKTAEVEVAADLMQHDMAHVVVRAVLLGRDGGSGIRP